MTALDDLREQLNRLLSESELAPDIRNQFKSRVESWLTQLNLVSREEFDAQTKALELAQQQLRRLEQQLDTLKSEQNSVD